MDLYSEKITEVRFNETDALKIVWHGNYIKYFEDGREDFGKKYGIGYLDILNQGYITPLTDIHLNFKKILKYGDSIKIKTRYIDTIAAKIKFEYEIFSVEYNELVCTGNSTQVFTDIDFTLVLAQPRFYKSWRKKHRKNEAMLHN